MGIGSAAVGQRALHPIASGAETLVRGIRQSGLQWAAMTAMECWMGEGCAVRTRTAFGACV